MSIADARVAHQEPVRAEQSEVEAYFKNMGQDTVPPELWENEDKDGDGFISWEEFSGPKGSNPLGDEL